MSSKAQYRRKTTNPNAPWTDGFTPTTVKRPTTFERRNVREDGVISAIKTSVVGKKPRLKNKLYIHHYMASFAGVYGEEELDQELRHMIEEQGCNGLWIHPEDGDFVIRDGNQYSNVVKVVRGCERVGLPFAVGLKHGGAWGDVWQALDLTINSPMGLKDVEDRPLLFDYHLFPGNYINVVKQVESREGWTMDDVLYLPEMQLPLVQGGLDHVDPYIERNPDGSVKRVVPEWSEDNPYPMYQGYGAPQSKDMVNYLAEHFFDAAGFMGWQGENVTADSMIANAKSFLDACKESKRLCAPAWVFRYASDTGYSDIGFAGGLKYWQWLVSLKPEDRPDIQIAITANDWAESTPHNKLPNEWPFKGLGGLLKLNPHFGNGDKIRHPDVQNTGIDAAFLPFIKCFTNDDIAPVITEDKVFYKVTLHPADVKPRTKSPLLYQESDEFYNAGFANSMYARPYGVSTVAVAMQHATNVAEILIHSKSPVQGEIAGVRSDMFPAGFSTFSTDLGNKEGSIQVRTLVKGKQALNAYTEQPRLNDIFPYAYKPMILEGNPSGKTYPAKPVLKVKDGVVTATVSSKLPIVYRLDHSLPKPYTGPVKIPDGLRAWFYTEETDKYNESPVALY